MITSKSMNFGHFDTGVKCPRCGVGTIIDHAEHTEQQSVTISISPDSLSPPFIISGKVYHRYECHTCGCPQTRIYVKKNMSK